MASRWPQKRPGSSGPNLPCGRFSRVPKCCLFFNPKGSNSNGPQTREIDSKSSQKENACEDCLGAPGSGAPLASSFSRFEVYLSCFVWVLRGGSLVWYGKVWYVTVRYGMVLYGMVWYGGYEVIYPRVSKTPRFVLYWSKNCRKISREGGKQKEK